MGAHNIYYTRAILGVGLGDLSIKRILSAWGRSFTSSLNIVPITLQYIIELPTTLRTTLIRFSESVHCTVSVRVVKVYWFVWQNCTWNKRMTD